ncbi:MAG: hypothetical protein NC918_08250 [Candidatus Omnitrophica bacterium]|nr:hypothetical protein [Candidatus Omnitrophota bacterium]
MERRKIKKSYKIYLKQIEAIANLAKIISSGTYLDELLLLVVNVTAEIMNSKICSLMLLDTQKKN